MSSLPILAFTDGDRWHAGIGDPTIMGWLTVVAYAVATLLCLRQALREKDVRARLIFWTTLGAIMLLLGINKQLDLQTWFTFTGRKIALSQGWYSDRRNIQFIFVILVAVGGLLSCLGMWRLVEEEGEDLLLPLSGLFVVVCFVIVRAASFHHFDEFLHWQLAGFKINWLLELGGISIIIAGTLKAGNQWSLLQEE